MAADYNVLERAGRTGENHEFLLTPGPLTTSKSVKAAMQRDWGSWDQPFIDLTAEICTGLNTMAGGGDDFVCVPIQGSGTFAVEAMLGTMVPRGGHCAVLVNGAYGERIVKILEVMGRCCTILRSPETKAYDVAALDEALRDDCTITHVAAVHCETTSGVLNPLNAIAVVTARHGRALLVDAMSSFAALPIDVRALPCDGLVSSANKCIQGVPGMGFAILRRKALATTAGNAHSLSLDLHDQWVYMEKSGRWRFTPPTHSAAALAVAIDEHTGEGGVGGRGGRYASNHGVLVRGMREMGFETLLADAVQSPIITAFLEPADSRFSFERFYDLLAARGFVVYPGKLTVAPTFRIGTIGAIEAEDIRGLLKAVRSVLNEMGVRDAAPARETTAAE
ncbi:2-aminoethylphosphonate--pyruvate transaminase [Denitrobaculum tricleocarpae]|uniref:2-aminoethylphosphonate--pyruvate transaminase n=2 Tax=Denitrobaculum tricleocarpae TaxID=2591009 RepID=A0A545TGP4_9PROT|nr:2-aminoethylphosphonate--pyruvate transaminase [Denitrobaculum tricleocarpae]